MSVPVCDGQSRSTRGGSQIETNMIISIRLLIFLAALWLFSEGKTSLPYKSDGDCVNSTSEYFNKLLSICCSKCKPGTRQQVECTAESDTICAPCQDGQYSDNMNHFGNCFSCKKCNDDKGLKYVTKCSADTNSVCECKLGMFCYRYQFDECEACRKYKSCKPGEGVIKNGTSKSNVKCAHCSEGTFSNSTNTEPCKPHTRCVGSAVLRPGNSTTDTKCDTTPFTTNKVPPQISTKGFLNVPPQVKPSGIQSSTQPMNTTFTPSLPVLRGVISSTTRISSNLVSVRPTSNPEPYTITIIYVIACSVMGLLTLTMIVIICRFRNRKAGVKKAVIVENNKQEQGLLANYRPDLQCLLRTDGCQKEPSTTSSDSLSQPDSSQSHSSNYWLEGASLEETLPEQPSVSSPLVNLSITATFNCQMNPTCCSIPLSPATLTPKAEAPVRLSQEEVCISCQQEDGKEALQSVQESNPCV